MEIQNDPKPEHITYLQSLLNEENRNNPVGGVGIIDLGSNCTNFQSVAIENGVAIGIATVQLGNELFKLYVDPQHRNKSIADNLVNHVMATLKADGNTEMFIEMTSNSLPFWARFVEKHQLEYHIYEGQLKADIKLK